MDYSKIDEIDEAGVRLFKIMMRLEFALKDIGYVRSSSRHAEVDWNRYANDRLGNDFYIKISRAPEARILFESPPKRQIVDAGSLGWENVQAAGSAQELIGAMQRVRNNLFHGGKSSDPDPSRNQTLYAAALFVVDQILLQDDGLQTSFTGNY